MAILEPVATAMGMKLVRPADMFNPDQWFGESGCWAPFGCPMLSVAGYHRLFHVPEYTPAQATRPALLIKVRDAVLEMARVLISSS